MPKIEMTVMPRQLDFINAEADEVLFGGAAGGGKSHGQLIDIFQYAMQFPGSQQIIFRTSFPELERTLIIKSLELYPKDVYTYTTSRHRGKFINGSTIEFAYLEEDKDVTKYQSAEYDTIRFDELTHFSEYVYTYMCSRLRGALPYPRRMKSSTNPGGVGHGWVKERFIDLGAPDTVHTVDLDGTPTTRLFLPSLVTDNPILMENDPDYVNRLKNLNESEYKALRFGEWNLFEGQYFTCWEPKLHIIEPFLIPASYPRYFAMDYGLDMLAGYWIAVDYEGRSYVYREVREKGLTIKEAALKIHELSNEKIQNYYAPPDLWNARQETGQSAADIFFEYGIPLTRAANNRVQGWQALHNELMPRETMFGETKPNLLFFKTCTGIIKDIPKLVRSKINPNDISKTPHDITHSPDAIRYYVAGRAPAAEEPDYEEFGESLNEDTQIQSFIGFGRSGYGNRDIYI